MIGEIKLNFDRDGYESFRFDEIARKISETVDPSTTDVERYVGLEHLNSGDIHIREYGSPDDVKGGKLKCYPGDVIFGKRRAYQRKAAIVDFESICSAHAFVFRANEEVIDPNLFPFFLHSDQFMHRMVDISVGGLSPTINWGDLKGQEFLLPPKDQQAEIAELLWALDKYESELIRTRKGVEQNFVVRRRALLLEACASNCRCMPLNEFGIFHGGLSGKSKKDFGVTGERYVTYTNVYDNEAVDFSRVDFVAIDPGEKQFALAFGDVIFTGSSETRDEVGMSSVVTEQPQGSVYLNSFCFVFRPRSVSELLPSFSKYYFRSDYVRKFMFKHGQGSTRFNLSKKTTGKKLMLSIPDVERQKQVVSELDSFRDSLRKIEQLELDCKNVRTALVNSLLGWRDV